MMDELSLATRMGILKQAFPSARLSLFQRHGIVDFSPEETLGDVLQRHGVANMDATLTALKAQHAALEEELRQGRLDVWREALLQFICRRRESLFALAAQVGGSLRVAAEEAVFRLARNGTICGIVGSAQTIRSQLARLEIEKWNLGLQSNRPPELDEINRAVVSWNESFGVPHKQWLDLCIYHVLAKEDLTLILTNPTPKPFQFPGS